MTWQPGDPDRRRNPGGHMGEDVGELRGALNAFIGEYTRQNQRFYLEFHEHMDHEARKFEEIDRKLGSLLDWKSEMTGGMKVAAAIWRIWATGMTVAMGWLSYLRASGK